MHSAALIEPLESRYAPAAVISISGPTSISEGNSGTNPTQIYTISLSEMSATDVTVDCLSVDGTAVKGTDYEFSNGAFTIPAGSLSVDVTVTVTGDNLYEGNESFSLALGGVSSGDATVGPQNTANVSITDDDPQPIINVAGVALAEGHSGQTPFNFVLTLTDSFGTPAVSALDVTVHVATAHVTTDGSDYTQVTDSLVTIPAGQSSGTFTVQVNGDTTQEGDETFTLNLSGATNAGIGTAVATGTILDDESLTFSVDDITVQEGAGAAVFTVRLSQPQATPVTIHYATSNGTAVEGQDYTSTSGTLTFAANELQKTISVVVVQDSAYELTETFKLTLSDPSTGTIADGEATATINDDDVPPVLTIKGPAGETGTVTLDEGNSSRTHTFTLSLDHASYEPITVHLTSADGLTNPATAGTDYLAINQDFTFAAGETTKTVTLTVIGDITDEVDELFTLTATSGSGSVTLPAAATTVKLRNDERLITVSDAQLVEGNSGATQMHFTLTLDQASDHDITLQYVTANGTATAGTDYTGVAVPVTITFAAGQTTKTIDIDILGDTAGEADETFLLNFSNVSGALINKTAATGTITDDDAYLSIENAQAVESGPGATTTMVFTVKLLRNTGTEPVTVQYQTADTVDTPAGAGSDYVAISPAGTLTFQPGETTKTISVTIIGDSTPNEHDETFLLKLSNASNGLPNTQATGTILDDDGLLTVTSASIVEGDSGTSNMVFVVNLIGLPTHSGNISVKYATEDVTAIHSGLFADYTETAGTLVFGPNITQKTISVPIIGDRLHEGDQTFTLKLSNTGIPLAEQASIGTKSVTGTITDNDPLPVFSISGGNVVEGASGAQIVFTVSLAGGAETPVSVNFKTQNGSATSGSDYTETTSLLLSFAPGQTSTTVVVPVLNDATIEGDETFSGVLSDAQGATIGTASATGTIRDDDITVTIAPTDFASAVTEGNSGVVKKSMTVSLSGSPLAGKPVTVNFTVTPGTATSGTDFQLLNSSNTLTFLAGQTSQTIDFNIIGDTGDEKDETFTVTLTGGTNAVSGGATTVTATIADDDATPSISISDAQLTEGNSGTATMNFTVRLSAASGQPVSFNASTFTGGADGTAAAGTDFTALSAQLITFAPGETVKTIPVSILGDTIDEQDETFTLKLLTPTNATFAKDSAVGTIVDNDARALSIGDLSIVEGNSGTKTMTFKVTLSSAAAQVITVDFETVNGSATKGSDFDVSQVGPLVFNPGDLSKDVVITVNGDTTVEADENFFVRLKPQAGTAVNAVIADGEAIGTISTDETQFTFDAVAISGVEEGATSGSANTLTFTIIRTGDHSLPGSVNYTTVDGTATSGATRPDFVAKTGTVQFAADETTKTVTVNLVNDVNHEANETFKLRLTGATNGVVVDDQGAPVATFDKVATITGSDDRPTVEILDTSISEGSTAGSPVNMVFTVRLRSGGENAVDEAEAITVNYETVAGTARDTASGVFAVDFTKVIGGSITFLPVRPDPDHPGQMLPAETQKTISISVLGDLIDENDETFSVKLTTATAATTPDATPIQIVGNGTAVGTIIDDDNAPVLKFSGASNGDISTIEGSFGNATIKPTLQLQQSANGPTTFSEKDVTVTVTIVAGTATHGVDYLTPDGTTFTVTIPKGSSTREIPLTIVGDNIREANETFTLQLSNAQNTSIADGGAKVTITDDDLVPQLVAGNVTLVEGESGTTNMIFTVSLQGATDQIVTVNYATTDGTAVSKGALPDFTAVSGKLSFAPGETTKTVSVPVFGDTWAEADETFTFTLSGSANATILTANGTGTIQNGADSVVGVVVQDAISVENPVDGNGTAISSPTMVFRVELTKALDTAVTFSAQTRNGTAIATGASDSDFVTLSQNFTIAAGQLSVNVPVSIKTDTVFESTESFFLGIGNVSSNAAEARGEGRGVILNDDLVFVDSRTLRYIDEDGDLATVTITKGALTSASITFGKVNSATGGRTLQLIDFTGNPTLFSGTDLRIAVEPQTGFAVSGLKTDGHVNVGFIRGAIPDSNTLQFTNGIDFANIIVPGDVGKITAGDQLITPSIRGKISIDSLGALGTTTGAPDNISAFLATVNSLSVTGDVAGVVQVIGNEFGNINSLKIGGSLIGDASSATKQSGIIFFTGTLGKATVGSIIGGAAPDSGVINGNTNFTAKIGSLHVLGDIVGGKGTRSGRVVAKTIGTVTVDGDVIGGGDSGLDSDGTTPKGSDSGEILATSSLNSVKIGGDVKGGIQRNTGLITSGGSLNSLRIGGSLIGGTGAVDTGSVIVNKTLSNLSITGDVVGGSGERGGTVQVGALISKMTLGTSGGTGGNVKGGSGKDSGTVSAGAGINQQTGEFVINGGSITDALIYGSIIGGTGDGGSTNTGNGSGGVQAGNQITKLDVRGSLIGGNSPGFGVDSTAASMSQSGFVLAGRLSQMTIGGDLVAGTDFGTGLADSGSIRVHENIGSLVILGNVVGNATNRAVISAGNNGPVVNGVTSAAIAKLTVGKTATNGAVTGGDVSFLDVLAGYGEVGTVEDPRGTARSADAQIGTVTVKGDILETNIVAGGEAGADGLFGTVDDVKPVTTATDTVIDKASVLSSIAKLIIGGQVLTNSDVNGIVAERIGAITVNGSAVTLNAGAGNDFTREIPDDGNGSKMQVNELTV